MGKFVDNRGAHLRKHGLSGSKEHRIWIQMTARCYNPKNKQFKNYGGRGIKVCKAWKGFNGFVTFLNDMGKCPARHSLDRVNNDKGYSAANCRWATFQVQRYNQSSRVHWLKYKNKLYTTKTLSEKFGIPAHRIRRRHERGWSIEEILFTPYKGKSRLWTHYKNGGKHKII